ncbi:MAG: hypothetical protein JO203_13285 [Gammaproteobacteria bacterium]|nr:hypothetical protein [Gammaproteobacteria bacterium]
MRLNSDRPLIAALAVLGVCAVSVALADPPAAPAAATATPATTTPAAAAASADAAAQAAEDKRLLAAGYKPEMRKGTKVWCRNETEIGSHLGGHKVCGTADEIKTVAHDNQESVEQAQRRQINPNGH